MLETLGKIQLLSRLGPQHFQEKYNFVRMGLVHSRRKESSIALTAKEDLELQILQLYFRT